MKILVTTGIVIGCALGVHAADNPVSPYASSVPKYVFGETLAEQERQLAANPMLERFRVSRAERLKDPHHPRFHFTTPENKMNDPNGLSFWQGKWHLFYQGYPPEQPRQHWGHAVSEDLVHWSDLPYAIYPDPERACFSGSVFIEENRAIAMYHGTNAGTMVATSSDPLLLNWEKLTGKPVIPIPEKGAPKTPYNVFDPCVWKEGEMYYSLLAGPRGGKQSRAFYLMRSKDLIDWEPMHSFLENDRFGLVGDDGACPYFWPIGDDKHILVHFSHMSGGKFMIGEYDTERHKFVVEDGADFNFGAAMKNGLHAPSAYPDGEGGVIAIFNVNEPEVKLGFDRIMSLPRRLTLRDNSLFNPLNIEPAGAVETLRGEHVRVGRTELPANEEIVIEQVRGNTMEIIAEIEPSKNQTIEIGILRSANAEEVTRIQLYRDRGLRIDWVNLPTVVSLDTSRSSTAAKRTSRPPEVAQVDMMVGEPLKLRIFIDRSIVEVFVNGRQCLTVRAYPERGDSVGVSLKSFGQTATLTSLDAWQMGGIYDQN